MGLRAGTTVTFAGFNRRMRKTACPVVWEGAGSIPAPTRSAKNQTAGRTKEIHQWCAYLSANHV